MGLNYIFNNTAWQNVCSSLFLTHSVSVVKPSVLTVLLAADLQGLRYTDSVEAALQMESEKLPNDWQKNLPIAESRVGLVWERSNKATTLIFDISYLGLLDRNEGEKSCDLPPTTDWLSVRCTTARSQVMSLFFSSEESVALNFVTAKLDFANNSTTLTLHSNIGPIVFFLCF